jgi:hypothetical protein
MATIRDPERPPSGLYEGRIVPLQRYKIRGAIWYFWGNAVPSCNRTDRGASQSDECSNAGHEPQK